jgi:hypothetical protein
MAGDILMDASTPSAPAPATSKEPAKPADQSGAFFQPSVVIAAPVPVTVGDAIMDAISKVQAAYGTLSHTSVVHAPTVEKDSKPPPSQDKTSQDKKGMPSGLIASSTFPSNVSPGHKPNEATQALAEIRDAAMGRLKDAQSRLDRATENLKLLNKHPGQYPAQQIDDAKADVRVKQLAEKDADDRFKKADEAYRAALLGDNEADPHQIALAAQQRLEMATKMLAEAKHQLKEAEEHLEGAVARAIEKSKLPLGSPSAVYVPADNIPEADANVTSKREALETAGLEAVDADLAYRIALANDPASILDYTEMPPVL